MNQVHQGTAQREVHATPVPPCCARPRGIAPVAVHLSAPALRRVRTRFSTRTSSRERGREGEGERGGEREREREGEREETHTHRERARGKRKCTGARRKTKNENCPGSYMATTHRNRAWQPALGEMSVCVFLRLQRPKVWSMTKAWSLYARSLTCLHPR